MSQEGAKLFHAPRGESVLMNTVDAVADFKDVPASELAPMYDSVDPEALEQLVDGSGSPVHVTFRYEGLDITVRTDGRISIRESVIGV